MVVFEKLSIETSLTSSILTIGSFDGMHLGHLKVLELVKDLATKKTLPSVVISFHPHPKVILSRNNEHASESITSINKKLELLDAIGIDYLWLLPFNKDIANVTADLFLNDYIMKNFNPNDIVIGYDHHFGHNKEGNKDFLYSKSSVLNYKLHIISPFTLNNTKVSSTKIRKNLKSNKLSLANKMLGRKYEMTGNVIKGNGLGRKINFPTANIKPIYSNQLIPGKGVYCVDVILHNQKYLGMCNIGYRPTFYDSNNKVIEVHILTDNDLSLLNSEIKIIFKGFLRKENKYNSSVELVKQLEIDKKICIENYLT